MSSPRLLGWPFLVSRGRHAGYRTILAPDFLVDSGEASLLASTVHRVPDGGSVQIEEVSLPRSGSIEIVYRAERAMGDASGQDPAEPIRDDHSRPIRLFYGFVTRGRVGAAAPGDLSHCRAVAVQAFEAFLENEASSVLPATGPFPLASAAGRRPNAVEPAVVSPDPAPSTGSSRRARVLDAALVGAACVAGLLILLRVLGAGGGIEAEGPGCSALTPAAPTCVVNVAAGEEAERGLTVSISPEEEGPHWVIANGCASPLRAGASCQIEVTLSAGEGAVAGAHRAQLRISGENASAAVDLAGSLQLGD